MFNRRHYIFVADTIRSVREQGSNELSEGGQKGLKVALDHVTWAFADAFKADNANFDSDKFFNATVEGKVNNPLKVKGQ